MDSKWVEDKIITHDKRLDAHADKLDELDRFKSSSTVEIRNLIEQIKSLVSTIKWFMTFSFATLMGFFIWYIQQIGR